MPAQHHKTCEGNRSRGSALMVVLWVGFGLVALTLVHGHGQAWAYRQSDGLLATAQSRAAIEGAVRYIESLMRAQSDPGRWPVLAESGAEDLLLGDSRFWFVGRSEDPLRSDTPAFGLIDEGAKLNLNTATADMLARLPGMDPDSAAAIVDWRGEAGTSAGGDRPEGALPLASKGGAFETVEELLLVPGIDAHVLYGHDHNRNGVRDGEDYRGEEFQRGLIDYVTVYTRERNLRNDGSTRVQVNASPQPLRSALEAAFGEDRARDLMERLQASSAPPRSLLEVFLRTGMTAEEQAAAADILTFSSDPYLHGLVNVNSAPAEVLACLPGMDQDTARLLVAYRDSMDERPVHTGWILEAIPEEAALAAGPYVTARTSQIMADIVALGRKGRGYRRSVWILDFSGEQPRPVYRRDLHHLGWALGSALAHTLTDERTLSW